ncbi:MAG: T9SS C-terminal target domain-containing protein [Bacteroidetes bacterium]|nr:MAG: T9SS C-terminal target domain-containing protein [Bacteroidota bacterium]TAG88055.1 MAG: T9SS C-terminal target domain-containing protein [Bacteroidota bacterium]
MQMKNKMYFSYLYLFVIIVFRQEILAQSFFNASGNCMVNANTHTGDAHALERKATFKYVGSNNSECSGTLINQATNNGQNPRQLFYTSWHCLRTVDFSRDFIFIFNYQSRNDVNENTPTYNRGQRNIFGMIIQSQTNRNVPFVEVDANLGYGYTFRSRVRLIHWTPITLGDMALCEIIEPIPPHFDVAYAGWVPHLAAGNLSGPFTGFSHPSGDIKKLAITHNIFTLNNNLNRVCTLVTGFIERIIRFFSRRARPRTRVICNYVDYPFYMTNLWTRGGVERGSSGSNLLNRNHRIVGNLMGWGGICGFRAGSKYGKFKNFFRLRDVNFALNPSNSNHANFHGVGSRTITCYPVLEDLYGQYFPAADYGNGRNIVRIASASHITTKISDFNDRQGFTPRPLVVHGVTDQRGGAGVGANYELSASTFIELNDGFTTHIGATFEANLNGCPQQRVAPQEEENAAQGIEDVYLPKVKKFDWERHLAENKKETFKVYPNPAQKSTIIEYFLYEDIKCSLYITNSNNEVIKTIFSNSLQKSGKHTLELELENLPLGLYFCVLETTGKRQVQKLVIIR